MRIRVVTLNVWNTEGDPRRVELINRELKRLEPDLVAFQEVVSTVDARMLDHLVDGLGLQSTHQADVQRFTPPFADKYGGSAIATRWPHTPLEALDLRIGGANDIPWATLAASVAIPNLGELLFVAATTAWRPSTEVIRERQVVAISDLDARHRRTLPTIIAGDFNASPEAASIRFLTGRQSLDGRSVLYHDAWEIAGDGAGHTWSAENPNARAGAEQIIRQPNYRKRFDYVFVGSWDAHPKAHARVQSASLAFDKPSDGVWLSDHFGVAVELDVGADG
jgi:endonuclease/exonuclease/phosphatase family metal-dependent hydrolase